MKKTAVFLVILIVSVFSSGLVSAAKVNTQLFPVMGGKAVPSPSYNPIIPPINPSSGLTPTTIPSTPSYTPTSYRQPATSSPTIPSRTAQLGSATFTMGSSVVSQVAIQSQSVDRSEFIRIGREADGSQDIVEIYFLNNRTVTTAMTFDFPFAAKVTFLDGRSLEGQAGQHSIGLTALGNGTVIYSSQTAVQTGQITFHVNQTWNAKLGQYVDDMAIQMVSKHIATDGHILSVEATTPTTTSFDGNSFRSQAVIRSDAQTGVTLTNNNPKKSWVTLAITRVFNQDQKISIDIKVKPGQTKTVWLKDLFGDLPNDAGGNILTDGSLSIEASRDLFIQVLRLDAGSDTPYLIPSFCGISAMTPDTVTITIVKQKDSGQLVLRATSSEQPDAVLTASVAFIDGTTTTRQLIWDGIGEYFLPKEFFPLVVSVNITSSSGGTSSHTL